MSRTREIKKSFEYCGIDAVEGSGSELTVKLSAYRKTKAGTHEKHELQIKICRSGIRRFLELLKEMHVRDRERIAREQQRIQNEIDALKVSP